MYIKLNYYQVNTLRNLLDRLYLTNGTNDETLALSQIVDNIILQEQKKILNQINC